MAKRKPGRPAAGEDGQKTSEYPKLFCVVRPSTRAALDAVTALQQRSTWEIVDEALTRYIEALSAEDRYLVEAIVRRSKRKG